MTDPTTTPPLKAFNAIALLSNMIDCGEGHTEQSRAIVRDAYQELNDITRAAPEAPDEDEADNQLCDERVDGPFVKVDIEDLSEAPNARAEALQGYSDTHSIPWKPEPKWR